MRVQVDEPRRHYEPGDVDDRAPAKRCGRDRRDAAVPNAHRPDAVETGLRVNDTSVGEHEIEGASVGARARVASAPSRRR